MQILSNVGVGALAGDSMLCFSRYFSMKVTKRLQIGKPEVGFPYLSKQRFTKV